MDPKIEEEYMVVNIVENLWDTLTSAYKLQLKLNIGPVGEDIQSIKSQECSNVDNYTLQIDQKNYYFNLCTEQQITDTDIADID